MFLEDKIIQKIFEKRIFKVQVQLATHVRILLKEQTTMDLASLTYWSLAIRKNSKTKATKINSLTTRFVRYSSIILTRPCSKAQTLLKTLKVQCGTHESDHFPFVAFLARAILHHLYFRILYKQCLGSELLLTLSSWEDTRNLLTLIRGNKM